ncbi:MAG: protein kinase [Actinomycetota bacterium]|nr:protein kinase [Actinomycetota bacterium]
MRAGDVIHGYRLLEDFRVVGAGLSEWSFAERDGRAFFIKRFLSPTYPDDAAPGSAKTKAAKRARCAAFEAHHRGIQTALAPVTSYGGNLIATLDFFRAGAKYYKVTEKVDLAGLETADVATLPFPAQLVLLKTVAHSLKILHDLDIVHSDLKPSNVMIKRTELGYTTKLIDFDSSYIVGHPPPAEEIVGTMNYYSPELVRYIQGAEGSSQLTEASDIFALGLIYAEYLTGSAPPFDPAHHEPAIAVLNGETLRLVAPGLPAPLVALVESMMSADPADRPHVGDVHASLMGLRSVPATTRAAPRPSALRTSARRASASRMSGPVATPATSSLRGKGLRLATAARGTPPAESERASAVPVPAAPLGAGSGAVRRRGRILLGKLVDKLEARRR